MKKKTQYCIYWITDSKLGEDWSVAYVGMTSCTPEKRLKEHIQSAKGGSKTALAGWIRERLAAGVKIGAFSIVSGIATERDARLAEGKIIHHFLTLGANLMNSDHVTSKGASVAELQRRLDEQTRTPGGKGVE